MDALILAAGFGSRLQGSEPSKPLARIGGRTLLEIAVVQLARAGATRVVVATGYRAEEIEAALPGIAARTRIPVEARRVADCRQSNGHSVLAGAADFDGPFLLVMADHLLSDGVFEALAAAPSPENGVMLAVDRRIDHPLLDAEDATWVATGDRNRITRIGKTIDPFDAVDCGAFLATPGLLDAIRAAIAAGKAGSLSEGMQQLADAGRAFVADIGNAWWLDVDDERSLTLARALAPRHIAPAQTAPTQAIAQ